jgi:hypothetical protein
MISLGRATLRLAFLAKPSSISRGRSKEDFRTPRSCDLDVGFSQAPEHVEGGGYGMRKEEVVLDS